MAKIPSSPPIAGALFLLCLATVPAEAIADHTYVSGKGTDTGGCTSPAIACRTFAYAITQTSASGIIIVIDPADYAPVTITKAISIVADGGGPAGIFGGTGNAITINAGASDIVNLRGLTLDGEGTAGSGIVLNSAGFLTITDCFVRDFQNPGILLSNTNNTGTGWNASILNSVMNNNGRLGANNNLGSGLAVTGAGRLKTFVTVRKSVANYNVSGISVGFATLTLADTMVTGNTLYEIVLSGTNSGGTVVGSYGDNELDGNGANVPGGTLTPFAKQ